MAEEKKEKPDWLYDFQNKQATGDEQTSNGGNNDQLNLDLYGHINTYISPRYGRRSNAGVKSVENSPKKSTFHDSKSFVVRSCSARPALLNNNISVNDLSSEIQKAQYIDNFTSSLQMLQNDFENFSFTDFSWKTLGKACNLGVENLLKTKQSYENLEDSWNSLNVFKIKQKGRLGPTTKNVFLKEKEENKLTADTLHSHQLLDENIFEDEKFRTKNKNGSDELKNKGKIENWEKSINLSKTVHENITSKVTTKDFVVPELPQGKTLIVNIKTTWGDKHYLGLNGIEIFNSKGKKVQVKSIMADPPDINILPEYSRDPRIVENLVDNIYLTQDDMHMWLAPFTPNSSHLIFIEFYETEILAMLRIWNYNKSRIHCFRGAKDVEITLDNRFIFIGEIARASGEIINTLNCLGDTILFTTDDDILELVSENDEYFVYSTLKHLEVDQTQQEDLRPLTGGNNEKQSTQIEIHQKKHSAEGDNLEALGIINTESEKQFCSNLKKINSNCTENSYIDVSIVKKENYLETVKNKKVEGNLNCENYLLEEKPEFLNQNYTLYIPSASLLASDSAYETLSMPTGYNFTIQIHSTWGDLYYVGLNGLKIFDENNMEIKVHPNNITADPESINMLDGIDHDARTPDKLVDGINDSVDGCHMWLAPVLPLTINRIDLIFQEPVTLSALKLWNYAKTPSRGVREFGVLVDGLLVYNGELDQAVIPTDGGLPKVPCKTVNFSNPDRVQYNGNNKKEREETTSRILGPADQSQRPFTTMTNLS